MAKKKDKDDLAAIANALPRLCRSCSGTGRHTSGPCSACNGTGTRK